MALEVLHTTDPGQQPVFQLRIDCPRGDVIADQLSLQAIRHQQSRHLREYSSTIQPGGAEDISHLLHQNYAWVVTLNKLNDIATYLMLRVTSKKSIYLSSNKIW
jgi:hypothetical protein